MKEFTAAIFGTGEIHLVFIVLLDDTGSTVAGSAFDRADNAFAVPFTGKTV